MIFFVVYMLHEMKEAWYWLFRSRMLLEKKNTYFLRFVDNLGTFRGYFLRFLRFLFLTSCQLYWKLVNKVQEKYSTLKNILSRGKVNKVVLLSEDLGATVSLHWRNYYFFQISKLISSVENKLIKLNSLIFSIWN